MTTCADAKVQNEFPKVTTVLCVNIILIYSCE